METYHITAAIAALRASEVQVAEYADQLLRTLKNVVSRQPDLYDIAFMAKLKFANTVTSLDIKSEKKAFLLHTNNGMNLLIPYAMLDNPERYLHTRRQARRATKEEARKKLALIGERADNAKLIIELQQHLAEALQRKETLQRM